MPSPRSTSGAPIEVGGLAPGLGITGPGYTPIMDSNRDGANDEVSLLAHGVRRLERATALDGLARTVARLVRPISEGPAGDGLRGDWLGHALHPPLTDFALGCWVSAGVVDLLAGDKGKGAATTLVGTGLLAAAPTALSGAAEWRSLTDRATRRVAAVHATGNSAVILCYLGSWLLRRSGRHRAGIGWGLAGAGLGLFTSYLGGHLSFGRGVGLGERWTTIKDPAANGEGGRYEPQLSEDQP